MRRLKSLLGASIILLLLACGEKPNPNTLVVGTIAGPETDLIAVAQNIAHSQFGLTIKLIEFSDYNLPNAALQDGTLDVNIFQHEPYLAESIKAHDYELQAVGKTFLYPMAIYSKQLKSLKDLRAGGIIAIPNDPSNEARALLLLQSANLIHLKNNGGTTVFDISANPQHYQFRELDAAQLTRVLPDVDLAVINTNFAIAAGLNPNHHALFVENKNSPYANLIVIRKDSTKKSQIKQFIAALHSPEVVANAKQLFAGAAIPAW